MLGQSSCSGARGFVSFRGITKAMLHSLYAAGHLCIPFLHFNQRFDFLRGRQDGLASRTSFHAHIPFHSRNRVALNVKWRNETILYSPSSQAKIHRICLAFKHAILVSAIWDAHKEEERWGGVEDLAEGASRYVTILLRSGLKPVTFWWQTPNLVNHTTSPISDIGILLDVSYLRSSDRWQSSILRFVCVCPYLVPWAVQSIV